MIGIYVLTGMGYCYMGLYICVDGNRHCIYVVTGMGLVYVLTGMGLVYVLMGMGLVYMY